MLAHRDLRRRRPARLRIDPLEERAMPAAGLDQSYQWTGQLNQPGQVEHLTVQVPATDFNLTSGQRVTLGFAFQPAPHSSLDAAAFGLRPSVGAAATVI